MGASGAIFALLLAFAVYFPFSRIYLFGIIPIQSTMMVLLYAGIEIFSLVTGRAWKRGPYDPSWRACSSAISTFRIRLGLDPVRVFKDSRNNPWQR